MQGGLGGSWDPKLARDSTGPEGAAPHRKGRVAAPLAAIVLVAWAQRKFHAHGCCVERPQCSHCLRCLQATQARDAAAASQSVGHLSGKGKGRAPWGPRPVRRSNKHGETRVRGHGGWCYGLAPWQRLARDGSSLQRPRRACEGEQGSEVGRRTSGASPAPPPPLRSMADRRHTPGRDTEFAR